MKENNFILKKYEQKKMLYLIYDKRRKIFYLIIFKSKFLFI